MKVLSFGSLNFDYVYNTDHFVLPKETIIANDYHENFGGKGLNQSIALAKAGLEVYHAGRVGKDGQSFFDYLNEYDVHTDYLYKDESITTGHAIIEVHEGQNRIICYGGGNQKVDHKQIDDVLSHFEKGDLLLIQNEISSVDYLITKAHEAGMKIAFNCAPITSAILTYPLEYIDIFVVNEVEAKGITEIASDNIDDIIKALQDRYHNKEVVLTVGEQGSYYIYGDKVIHKDALKVDVVDTTAAGDTFTGYFLASYMNEHDVDKALALATKASSITVQGLGAAKSIPYYKDLI